MSGKPFYGIAITFFFGYLLTKRSGLMASGGVCMMVGAIAMISAYKKK